MIPRLSVLFPPLDTLWIAKPIGVLLVVAALLSAVAPPASPAPPVERNRIDSLVR